MKIGVRDVKDLSCLVISSWISSIVFTCMLFMAFAITTINAVLGLWRWKGDKDVD